MKKKNFIIILIILASIFSIANFKKAQAQTLAAYNPNYIISNVEMLDVYSLSLAEIQSFLEKKGSYLANYQTLNAYGELKTAAEIIYDACRNNYDCEKVSLSDNPTEAERSAKCKHISTISPKVLLVLLQKEQSLIENPSPSQKALDEATGYGCPTGQTCNPYWKGFGKQVNSAALQIADYMKNPNGYGFKVNNIYIAKDKYSKLKSVGEAVKDGSYNSIVSSPDFVNVTIENQATAALYIYTPHVYNGNYNFYRLYNSYFSNSISSSHSLFKKIYPDGSLLKLADSPGIWLIEGGKKRPFLNYSAFISRFSPKQVIITSTEILAAYPEGENIKFSDYSLVQTPDENIYLLVGKEKRPFDSFKTFRAIGFHEDELEPASSSELSNYITGKSITAQSTYVTGALLQDISTGGVYYVENDTKAPLLDKVFLESKFKDYDIVRVSPEILEKYLKVDPILFPDGTLLKSNSFPAVYLISNGEKRSFVSEKVFNNLGYKMENIITVSSQVLYYYPLGEPIQ